MSTVPVPGGDVAVMCESSTSVNEASWRPKLTVSAELRAEVAKTYKESLSLTVLKKAQEIEKLARSLKVRMNQEAAAAARNQN